MKAAAMYLADYDDAQLAGLGSKLKKALKKVTNVVVKPIKEVNKFIGKNVPNKLQPLTDRIGNTAVRIVSGAINPLELPKLLKEEIKDIESLRKDPAFMKLAGQILSVAAFVYPMLQPIAAAWSLAQAAAERAAAKKLMAKDQAEADAAQAEFDKYMAELAALQAESEKLKATPIAPPPAAVAAKPITAQSVPLAPTLAPQVAAQPVSMFAPELSRQFAPSEAAAAAAQGELPSWIVPAGIGAAALVLLPLIARRK